MRSEPRPLLVGELNPRGADPRAALFPRPRGAAGDRLRKILGLTDLQYLCRFRRVNLCVGEWDDAEAAVAAWRVAQRDGPFILLGVAVAQAFGMPAEPFRAYFSGENAVLVLPHPSGRCRAWNDPTAAARARRMVLKLVWQA